jgi:polysaccharide export outer membrane protein
MTLLSCRWNISQRAPSGAALRWLGVLSTVLAFCLVGSDAHSAYRLADGDVLNVSVFGVPELQTKATIDVDGYISFPLIGKVKVSGLSVDDVRSSLATMITQHAGQSSGGDAASSLGQITATEITVSVAEYRPVYITGDVVRSGAEPFLPGITVRQAIALAGGVDNTRGSLSRPSPDERTTTVIDYARERSRVWRLEQECSLLDKIDQPAANSTASEANHSHDDSLASILSNVPAAPTLLSQIVASETEQLKLDESAWDKEFSYLKQAKEQINGQLKLLLQQQAAQQTEAQQSSRDSQQVQALYSEHLATLDRMAGVRRDSESTSNQLLQVGSLIIQAQRELNDLDERGRQFESDQRIAKVRELEDAKLALAKLTAKLQLLGNTFLMTENPAQPAASPSQQQMLTVSITRDANGTPTFVSANQDTELVPGDTVNINETRLTE